LTACRRSSRSSQALKDVEPFKTVLSGNHEAIAGLSLPDLERFSPRRSQG
jgi:hypothetical protein